MTNPDEICHNLSDRLLLMRNSWRKAMEGYEEFDHQRAKTFLAMLDESYEDALLMEGAQLIRERERAAAPSGQTVITFPGRHVRPHLVEDTSPDGAA